MNVNRCTERDGVKLVFGAEVAAGCFKGLGGKRRDDAVCGVCWGGCAGLGGALNGVGRKSKELIMAATPP